jgi:hypothetical protein
MIQSALFCLAIAGIAYLFKHLFLSDKDCIKTTMATYSMGALLLPVVVRNPIDIDIYNTLIIIFTLVFIFLWAIAYIDETAITHPAKIKINSFNLGVGTSLFYIIMGLVSPKAYHFIMLLSKRV